MDSLILSGKIKNGCKFEVHHCDKAAMLDFTSYVTVVLLSHFRPEGEREIVDEGDMPLSEIGSWLENRLDY